MKKPEHLFRFPSMTYREGCRFINPSAHKRLLVLGESHYLPKTSTIHLNPNNWYSATECQLNDEEIGWVSTRKIIDWSKQDGFRIKAHGIYKSIAREVNAAGLGQSVIEAIEDH